MQVGILGGDLIRAAIGVLVGISEGVIIGAMIGVLTGAFCSCTMIVAFAEY